MNEAFQTLEKIFGKIKETNNHIFEYIKYIFLIAYDQGYNKGLEDGKRLEDGIEDWR